MKPPNEQALKDHLRNLAKEEGKTSNEIWKRLLLERFLARLSHSDFKEKLIFKGGVLLSHYLEIGRETIDLDFVARQIERQRETFDQVFQAIAKTEIEDGFQFSHVETKTLTQPHMNYPGYRVILKCGFEGMRDSISVDVGIGDVVEPTDKKIPLLKVRGRPLFEGEISLKVYPLEAIFAEKLETLIARGGTNSRMKDFHDLLLMVREPGLLEPESLGEVITCTFENRQTKLVLPIHLKDDEIKQFQKLWNAHCRRLGEDGDDLGLPKDFSIIIDELNSWLAQNLP